MFCLVLLAQLDILHSFSMSASQINNTAWEKGGLRIFTAFEKQTKKKKRQKNFLIDFGLLLLFEISTLVSPHPASTVHFRWSNTRSSAHYRANGANSAKNYGMEEG